MRSLAFKSLFIWVFVFPLVSQSGYNLSPFYANLKKITFESLGAIATASGGYVTGKSFGASTDEGAFSTISGIAIDKANDHMYVLDSENYRVQKLTLSTGAFIGAIGKSTATGTCMAGAQTSWCTGGTFSSGTGDGEFSSFRGIALDVTNDVMIILDQSRVQKFVLSTGAFVGAIGNSTASGTCVAGKQTSWCTGGVFSTGTGDGMITGVDLAIDPDNDHFFVLDPVRVQKFTLSTGAFVGAIGNSTASGTCVAGKQTSWCTGGVFSFASAGDGLFGVAQAIAVDTANGHLFVADAVTATIQKFTLSTGAYVGTIGYGMYASGTCSAAAQTSWCTGGAFAFFGHDGSPAQPFGIAIDTVNDRMYVTNAFYHRLHQFVLSTGAAVGSIGYSSASGTCTAGSQSGWCTGGSFGSGTVDGTFTGPRAVLVDTAGNALYVTDGLSRIQKFTRSTGAFVGALGGALSASGAWTSYLASGPMSSYSGDGAFTSAVAAAIDSTNDFLYVADTYRVNKFVLSTGAFVGAIGKSTAAGTCAAGAQTAWCTGGTFSYGVNDGMFSNASSIALDVTNNLMYVSDSTRIQKFTLSTGAFVGAIGKSTAAGTCVAGKQTSWCTGGTFSTGSTDGLFNSIRSIAIDVTNNLMYAADTNNRRVQKFTLSTGAFVGAIGKSTTAGTCAAGAQTAWCTGGTFSIGTADGEFASPVSLAIDIAGNKLYVSDSTRIQRFTLSTGAYEGSIGNSTATGTCVAGKQTSWCTGGTFSSVTTSGGFYGSNYIALDKTNDRLYVTTNVGSRLQQFTLSTGAFVGALGNSTASGTCVAGAQTKWCVDGVFSSGSSDGMFSSSLNGVTYSSPKLYTVEGIRVQRFTP